MSTTKQHDEDTSPITQLELYQRVEKIEIRNVDVAEGLSEETTAFSADVYFEGEHIAVAKNRGRGGQTMVNAHAPRADDGGIDGDELQRNKAALQRARQYAESLPPLKYPESMTTPDSDFFDGGYELRLPSLISHLVNFHLHEQWVTSKISDGKTVYQVPSDHEMNEVTILDQPYNDDVGTQLRDEHGNDVVIWNQQLNEVG